MAEKGKTDALLDLLEQELTFAFSRSSGPGGQHANKVSSRVELRFPVTASQFLSESQKIRIMNRLGSRITSDGLLILSVQDERSQVRNKQLAVERFRELITEALRPVKKRIPTSPPPASDAKRLTAKKRTAEKKQARKRPGEEAT